MKSFGFRAEATKRPDAPPPPPESPARRPDLAESATQEAMHALRVELEQARLANAHLRRKLAEAQQQESDRKRRRAEVTAEIDDLRARLAATCEEIELERERRRDLEEAAAATRRRAEQDRLQAEEELGRLRLVAGGSKVEQERRRRAEADLERLRRENEVTNRTIAKELERLRGDHEATRVIIAEELDRLERMAAAWTRRPTAAAGRAPGRVITLDADAEASRGEAGGSSPSAPAGAEADPGAGVAPSGPPGARADQRSPDEARATEDDLAGPAGGVGVDGDDNPRGDPPASAGPRTERDSALLGPLLELFGRPRKPPATGAQGPAENEDGRVGEQTAEHGARLAGRLSARALELTVGGAERRRAMAELTRLAGGDRAAMAEAIARCDAMTHGAGRMLGPSGSIEGGEPSDLGGQMAVLATWASTLLSEALARLEARGAG